MAFKFSQVIFGSAQNGTKSSRHPTVTVWDGSKSQASARVHLPDPVFSRVINLSGSLGSKWKVSREGVVTGLRALKAAILCRTSSSLGSWAQATVVDLGTIGAAIIASMAFRLAVFLFRRDRTRTKSLIALFET
jgi:hypothetical protein